MSIKIFPKPLNKQLSKFSDPISTNDVLADALNVTETTYFKGSGSSYTGTVPSNNFKYGIFCVIKREANYIVHAISADGTSSNYYNGSAWEGWIVSTKSLNEQIGNIVKRITITSANCSAGDHIYNISKTTLGVDDCTQYEWFAHATGWNWESLPLVSSIETDYVRVREWVFSTATGNATLALQNGTLPYSFSLVGIKL